MAYQDLLHTSYYFFLATASFRKPIYVKRIYFFLFAGFCSGAAQFFLVSDIRNNCCVPDLQKLLQDNIQLNG